MNVGALLFLAALRLGGASGSPVSTNTTGTRTTVSIPAGTVVGSVTDGLEYYQGIPFAQPPVGSLRLRPPVRLEPFETVDATGVGPACPQMVTSALPPLAIEALSAPGVAEAANLGSAVSNVTEDCLTISVTRPQGTAPDANLPVLFWIFGGGFEIGSSQPYNASVLMPRGLAQNKPFIYVAVNYRLGGFGFLGGSEVLADGAANLGLLDQRMGLEWVADNIAGFGGNPDAVTIWGESAGAVSVFNQLALYDGNNTYNGRPLFHGAIMNSGSILSVEPVDGPRAQSIFDQVVDAAGCSSSAASDKLSCLRGLDYETFQNATNSVPDFLSYHALAPSYTPRPDGTILTARPDLLAKAGKYAAVPLIIGDMEDEGTLFAMFEANVTTRDAAVSYLNFIYPNATRAEIAGLVDTYPYQNGSAGSPFGTGNLNKPYPEFKRLAAIQGDIEFTLTRRVFLETVPASVPAWSFLASWGRGTPILGTYHSSDLIRVFYGNDPASVAMQDRYIAFVTSLDPNDGVAAASAGYQTTWPMWQEGRQLLEFGTNSTSLITDDFRGASFEYISSHLDALQA